MRRTALKAIKAAANIDMTATCRAAGVSFFPYVEGNEREAYSCNVYGWTGSLRRGDVSGALYAVTDSGNEHSGSSLYALDLGAREAAVVERLDRVEVLQNRRETGRAVIRLVSDDGHAFTVSCTDDGHKWTICG